MKSFHLICAKCGSMDILFHESIDKNDPDNNFIYTLCNNCNELTDIIQHNNYTHEYKIGQPWNL